MSAPTEAAIAQRLLEVIAARLEQVGAPNLGFHNHAADDVVALMAAYVSLTRAFDNTHVRVLDAGKG